MEHFKPFTKTTLETLTNVREEEVKIGQQIQTPDTNSGWSVSLKNTPSDYVIFGIPEDFGVMANHGIKGARHGWKSFVKAFVNLQSNHHFPSEKVMMLGHFDFKDEMKNVDAIESTAKRRKACSDIVSQIDKEVTHLVSQIVKAKKIPIAIGGGHNNAYGMIKGTALALGKPINAINFDAHTDMRPLEGRHSGNGFSYASKEGFLDRYFVFGVHESYTSDNIFNLIDKNSSKIKLLSFEDIAIRKKTPFKTALNLAEGFTTKQPFGLEIDCDAIQSFPTSAMSPSGFSTTQARRFVHHFSKNKKLAYLHICEAAPNPDNKSEMKQVGKLLTYLVSDFVNAASHPSND